MPANYRESLTVVGFERLKGSNEKRQEYVIEYAKKLI